MTQKLKSKSKGSRRKFLRNASLAAAGYSIVPRHVLGQGFVAPSDKLNIAGIGAGGKGESDLSSFAKSQNVNIVALVDVDDRQAVKTRQNFPKAKYYKDFREMLARQKNNRSEEHTSELQSRENLVCRLLLEKKKPDSTFETTLLT